MKHLTQNMTKLYVALMLIFSLFIGIVTPTIVSAEGVSAPSEDVVLVEGDSADTGDEVVTTEGLATLFKGILTAVIYIFNLIADFFMNLLDSILQT